MNKKLREGYTTGACAAAAAKAAAKALIEQIYLKSINISLPMGRTVEFLVHEVQFTENWASCYVIKDAGDDPDITHGVHIIAKVAKKNNPGIELKGGEGVGIVTKPGLPVEVGKAAINPTPYQMITNEVLEVLTTSSFGLDIEISVPGGAELAKKTLNSHLGIEGGLSILGTTGIVKPMSEEAYKKSLIPQLKVIYALGNKTVVLTPGNIGMKSAENYGIPGEVICQTSNFIGYMLEESVKIGFTRLILWGHPGKLVKIACGNFHTHNRVSDGRMETLAAHLAVLGAPKVLIEKILNCTTTERAISLIKEYNREAVWDIICKKISLRAERYVFNKVRIGTVLLKDRNNILAFDTSAQKIGEELGWPALL